MRYLVASDLHYGLQQLDWIAQQAPEFDAVVLAGDHLDVVGRAEINAQIALMIAYLGRLADQVPVFANSGNHDLTARRPDGEKEAVWLAEVDERVHVDGATVVLGADLVSVCAWWEGPITRGELEQQLDEAAHRERTGPWIWVYHSPPDESPTSWSGSRYYGDDALNELIDRHRPDLVLTGHVHEAPFRPEGAWHHRIGTTMVLNAGRQSGPIPAHMIVDSSERLATWWTSEGEATIDW